MGAYGDLADKAIMSIHVTEDPATAVEMHYDRHQTFAVFRANDGDFIGNESPFLITVTLAGLRCRNQPG
jgi:hypothetical protein